MEKSLTDKWIKYSNEDNFFQINFNFDIYLCFKNELTKHFNNYNIKFDENIYLKTFKSIDEKYSPNKDNKGFVKECSDEEVDKQLVNKRIKQSNESKEKYSELEEEINKLKNEFKKIKKLNEVLTRDLLINKVIIEEKNKIIKDYEKKLNESEEQLKNKEKKLSQFKVRVYFF